MVGALVFASFLGVVRQPGYYNRLESFTPGAMWSGRDWLIGEMLEYAPVVVLSDLGRMEILMAAVERLQEPREQSLWGKTYGAAFVQIVPRAIWPDRWLTSAGEFTDLVLGQGYYRSHVQFYGTWATGQMVEGFLNFHLPGLIVACWLVGLALATAEQYRMVNKGAVSAVVIYAVMFPMLLLLPMADFGAFLFTFGREIGPLLLAIRFASRSASDLV